MGKAENQNKYVRKKTELLVLKTTM
uniref:Uncharacterized protein n=1 Tax=Anguilla anguilla TaxID=7936 RepID=A0A0E9QLY2_ANGAN